MIVVLSILALVTALVMPMLTGAETREELRASARDIADALRSTRSLAMTRGQQEDFILDTHDGHFRAGPSGATQRLPQGVRLLLFTTTRQRIDDRTGTIRFFADGGSTGGGVRLTEGQGTYEVLVDWLTGRVSIVEGSHAAR